MHDHLPLFHDASDDWRDRWTMLRSFIKSWFWRFQDGQSVKRELHDLERWGAEVEATEAELGVKLPPSIKEWVSLCQQTDSERYNMLRDDFAMLWSDEDRVLVIQVICEGNVAWGVRRSDLHLEDPPVCTMDVDRYGDNDKSWRGNTWRDVGIENQTVTGFVLQRILYYLPSKTWINLKIPHPADRNFDEQQGEERAAEFRFGLNDFFERRSQFGNYQIFESKNVIAGLMPSDRSMKVVFRKPVDFATLPKWMRQFSSDPRLG